MSVRIMSAIFESETLGPTERLIMLSLADHADDDGRCYPSIERLCKRTGLSERAVQTNIKKLSEKGFIRVFLGGGKGRSNLYFVTPNPAADAPRTKCTPAGDAPQTPQEVRPNPAGGAPEPSGTIIEPSIEEADASFSIDGPAVHANDLSEAVAIYNTAAEHAGWPKVAKMTPQRTKSLRARIKDCGGIDGWRDALRKAYASDFIRNDWAGFNFDSLISQQKFTGLMEGKYDNRTHNRNGTPQGRQNRPDPALEQIARLAGLGQA